MAELRRLSGEVESHRRPSGRRVLLPVEADMCNMLGLTEDEYWEFVAKADAYTGERGEGYDHIPDVKNGPIIPILVNVAIGIALTAVSALLAPKPKQPDQGKAPRQLKTADQNGQSRFAPQTSFDSVQNLAALGSIIPLVFARARYGVTGTSAGASVYLSGGVRVQTQLLWSQMLSLGAGQQLRAVMMLSKAELEERPDFDGYAIGDMTLKNYTNAKLQLYFSTVGKRLMENHYDTYPQGKLAALDHTDAFSVYWDPTSSYQPYFSGARTPTTQVQFGGYAPMSNGMRCKVPYELVMVVDGKGQKENKKRSRLKRSKISASFPRYVAIAGVGNANIYTRPYSGLVKSDWDHITYEIGPERYEGEDWGDWGYEDIVNITESERITSDEQISIGELYMAGSALAVCTVKPDGVWNFDRRYYGFDVTDEGFVDSTSIKNTYRPWEKLLLMRCAVGTVSNNRACDCTEFGIKSTVFRQINGFPNVNSEPSKSVIEDYEEDGGSITLGNLNKYIKRLSFFRLEVRQLGVPGAGWRDISNGCVFCVKGQTPIPQYNYIRVNHPRRQHEFRFRPYPGNLAKREYENKTVYLLQSSGGLINYQVDEFSVAFSGERMRLDLNAMSNPEWIKNKKEANPTGAVVSISPSQIGEIPSSLQWVVKWTDWVEHRYDVDEGILMDIEGDASIFRYFHRGQLIHTEEVYRNGGTPYISPPYFFRTDENGAPIRYGPGLGTKHPSTNNEVSIAWELSGSYQEVTEVVPTSVLTVNPVANEGSGLQLKVSIYNNGAKTMEITNPGSGYVNGAAALVLAGNIGTVTLKTDVGEYFDNSLNPYDAVSDGRLYEAERLSNADSPEHEIVYVNEILETPNPATYYRLAVCGLRLNSTTEWSSFSSFSAFVKKGMVTERLVLDNGNTNVNPSYRASSNLLPEIAYGLLTNKEWGAGELVGADQVDKGRMTTAAKFCHAMRFTWDGVIDSRVNLREWIYEQAGYCLLDFTIIGGRFSLVPSVPTTTNGSINFSAKPDIKALFTDGNIRNLKVSFLSPEERQMFRAKCLWRQDAENGFPQTRSLSVSLKAGSASDPEETFDMSGFCTSEAHAAAFAKYALKLRQLVDHGITFETTPQAALGLEPGNYIRVVSQATHTSRFQNGSIGPEGEIVSAGKLNGTYQILYWEPGTEGVKTATLQATNNRTSQTALWGTLFTQVMSNETSRVYKVETISYAEDGLVEISGSFMPLTSDGRFAVLDWGVDFDVVSG